MAKKTKAAKRKTSSLVTNKQCEHTISAYLELSEDSRADYTGLYPTLLSYFTDRVDKDPEMSADEKRRTKQAGRSNEPFTGQQLWRKAKEYMKVFLMEYKPGFVRMKQLSGKPTEQDLWEEARKTHWQMKWDLRSKTEENKDLALPPLKDDWTPGVNWFVYCKFRHSIKLLDIQEAAAALKAGDKEGGVPQKIKDKCLNRKNQRNKALQASRKKKKQDEIDKVIAVGDDAATEKEAKAAFLIEKKETLQYNSRMNLVNIGMQMKKPGADRLYDRMLEDAEEQFESKVLKEGEREKRTSSSYCGCSRPYTRIGRRRRRSRSRGHQQQRRDVSR